MLRDNSAFVQRFADDYYHNIFETEVRLKLSQGAYRTLMDLKQDVALYRQRFEAGQRSIEERGVGSKASLGEDFRNALNDILSKEIFSLCERFDDNARTKLA